MLFTPVSVMCLQGAQLTTSAQKWLMPLSLSLLCPCQRHVRTHKCSQQKRYAVKCVPGHFSKYFQCMHLYCILVVVYAIIECCTRVL